MDTEMCKREMDTEMCRRRYTWVFTRDVETEIGFYAVKKITDDT